MDTAIIRSVGVVYLLSGPDDLRRRIPLAVLDVRDTFARQPGGRWLIAERQFTFLAGHR